MRSSMFLLVFLALGHCVPAEGQNYVLEVYFLIDPQVVKNYMMHTQGLEETNATSIIKADAMFFINNVKTMFQKLTEHGLSIELRIAGLEFAREIVLLSVQNNRVDASKALRHIGKYLESHTDIKFDAFILWTGHFLYDGSRNPEGYATVGTVCQSTATGVVQFNGIDTNALFTAHELGHILGAFHDGDDCPAEKGYVMTASNSWLSRNRWSFSSCSAKQMKDNFKTITCLEKGLKGAKPIPAPMCQDGRGVVNLNQICKRYLRDPTGTFCKQNPSHECMAISCTASSLNRCKGTMAPDDLICGHNKRCKRGSCVQAEPWCPTPKDLDEDCLHGETKVEGMDCKQYLDSKDHLCYENSVQKACCKTCKERIQITGPECQWGNSDLHPGFCEDVFKKEGDKACYKKFYAETCCKTCEEKKRNDTDAECQWGNRKKRGRGRLCSYYRKKENYNKCKIHIDIKEDCCLDCKQNPGAKQVCKSDIGMEFGESCEDYVKMNGNVDCFNNQDVQERCCITCKTERSKSTGVDKAGQE